MCVLYFVYLRGPTHKHLLLPSWVYLCSFRLPGTVLPIIFFFLLLSSVCFFLPTFYVVLSENQSSCVFVI